MKELQKLEALLELIQENKSLEHVSDISIDRLRAEFREEGIRQDVESVLEDILEEDTLNFPAEMLEEAKYEAIRAASDFDYSDYNDAINYALCSKLGLNS